MMPTRRAVLISSLERIPMKRTMMCGIPKYPRHHANAEIALFALKLWFASNTFWRSALNSPERAFTLNAFAELIASVGPPSAKIATVPAITNAKKINAP